MCCVTVEWSRFALHPSWVTGVSANHEYPMLTSNTYGVEHCNVVIGVGCVTTVRPRVARRHLLELCVWLRSVTCYCASVGCGPEKLAALSKGVESSSASGLIICAMSGWFCLSCMILVMAWMKALGGSTKAFVFATIQSGNEHSSSVFLIRAGLPACIRSRIATALFRTGFVPLFYSPLCSDPVYGGTVRAAGVPSAERNALSGNVAAGTSARPWRPGVCHCPSPLSVLLLTLSLPTVVARWSLAWVPCISYSTLHYETIGCFAVDLD